jgi:hypothetical protein
MVAEVNHGFSQIREILCSSPTWPITTLGRVLCAVLGTLELDSSYS